MPKTKFANLKECLITRHIHVYLVQKKGFTNYEYTENSAKVLPFKI